MSHGEHALFLGNFFHGIFGYLAGEDEFFDVGVFDKDFVDSHSAFVSGVVALRAAFCFFELCFCEVWWGFAGCFWDCSEEFGDFFHDFGVWGVGFATFCAQSAREALSHDDVDGWSEEEWFDAHGVESWDGSGGVVCVDGGEEEVTGEGCLDGCFRCF